MVEGEEVDGLLFSSLVTCTPFFLLLLRLFRLFGGAGGLSSGAWAGTAGGVSGLGGTPFSSMWYAIVASLSLDKDISAS